MTHNSSTYDVMTNSVIEGFGDAMKTGQFKILATIPHNLNLSFKSSSLY